LSDRWDTVVRVRDSNGKTGRKMRIRIGLATCAAVLSAALLASCGGGSSSSPLDEALGYLPSNAPAAIAISTDLDGGSFEDLDIALQRFGLQGGVEGAIDDALGEGAAPFAAQLKPQLGNDLVVGLLPGSEETGPQVVASLQVTDGGKVEDLLQSLDLKKLDEVDGATIYGQSVSAEGSDEVDSEPQIAVDGDTVVAAESAAGLRRALEQHGEDGRLTEDVFDERLGDLPEGGIIRASGDLKSAIDALGIEQTSGVQWMGALESFGVSLDVRGRTLSIDALVSTSNVDEGSLPIAAGDESPALIPHRASFGNLDQSQSMRFALDLVRASVPAATFNQIQARLERAAHGTLGALADQFGEGLLVELPGGEVASRSKVKDRSAVARTLAALSDEVPQVARLASEAGQVGDALQAARTLIPALPIPEDGFFPPRSTVTPVPGQPDLYELAAPAPRLPLRLGVPGPPSPAAADKFFFGLIGDVFVTAPSLRAARQAAALKQEDLGTPPGAVAFSIPVRASDLDLEDAAGNIALTVVKGGVEASPDALRLKATAGL
jgi:hypothetical protein